ncbi:MAG: carboxylesterase [Myxococcota bacterium]
MLDAIEVENGTPERSVIWMHGLGANGHDFEPIVPLLGADNTRFVFPHAPHIPVTINGGMVMPAWYDILNLDGPLRENLEQAGASAKAIEALISREVDRGIPTGRITVAGFSQGGAMALHVGLRYPVALAGIMVLSAYLLDADGTPAAATSANAETPIFFAHGTEDPVVRFQWGKLSYEKVKSLGDRDIRWHEYRMAHEVCPEEIRDIALWLNR